MWFSPDFFATRPFSSIHALPSAEMPETVFLSPLLRKYSVRPISAPSPSPLAIAVAPAWRGVCRFVCGGDTTEVVVVVEGGVLVGEKKLGAPVDRIEATCAGNVVGAGACRFVGPRGEEKLGAPVDRIEATCAGDAIGAEEVV